MTPPDATREAETARAQVATAEAEASTCPVIVRGPSGDGSCNCVLPLGHVPPHECACGVKENR